MRTDNEVSAQNPPEAASHDQRHDRRLVLFFLLLVIAMYSMIGYGIYKAIDMLT